MSIAPSAADRAVKRARVLAVLDARGADRLVLRSPGALSWYLDGARVHVSLAGEPVLAVVVDRGGDRLLVFENEAERLLAEELPHDASATLERVPWHDPLPVPTDAGTLQEADVAAELRAARASLLPAELERYRLLGRETAEVLTDVVLGLGGGGRIAPTERSVAAALAAALVGRGIDPLVTLVAGEERLGHRHPLPTASPLGDRAMLVVCGRRSGLIANATRWVRMPAAARSDAAEERDQRIRAVESAFLRASSIGSTIGAAFSAGVAAYGEQGFDPAEWRRHHQGGAAGYVGRDPRATPEVTDAIQADHAFAWNPSAPFTKVEDTVVVRASGIEVLTADRRWPTIDVDGRARPVEIAIGRDLG